MTKKEMESELLRGRREEIAEKLFAQSWGKREAYADDRVFALECLDAAENFLRACRAWPDDER